MGILKKAAVIGIAKKVYDEARKPQNQARIRSTVDKVQTQVQARRGRPGPR